MHLGLISDTHGDVQRTLRALRLFDQFRPEAILHCGDVGPGVLALFDGRQAHFVAGNTDRPEELRAEAQRHGQTYHDELGHLQLAGRTIGFTHGDNQRLLSEQIQTGQWDLLCHGHTHVATQYHSGPTLVVNPGAVYRASAPSVAVVELPSLEVFSLPL